MNAENYFTPEEKERIQQAVVSAESRTSGEIVPMVVGESDHYAEVETLGLVAGLLVGTAAAFIFGGPWTLSHSLLTWPVAGAALGFLLCQAPALKRRLVSTKRMDEAVKLRSLAAFTAQGVHETEARSGVLIFVSLFEHEVVVLADRGIHAKVAAGAWDEIVQILTAGLKSGSGSDALCRAIERSGEILAVHFPPRPDDRDELKNRLVTGD